jgi:hypothetical protein
MVKIGPYPRARRASRLWYNTVIFAFCSGRKGKRPLGAGKCNPTAPFAVTPRMPSYQLTIRFKAGRKSLGWCGPKDYWGRLKDKDTVSNRFPENRAARCKRRECSSYWRDRSSSWIILPISWPLLRKLRTKGKFCAQNAASGDMSTSPGFSGSDSRAATA